MLVQILQCIDDLSCVALHLQFMKSLPPLQQLVHALVRAEFEQDVYVFTVLEEVLKVAHVRMLDTPMNLDLAHELLLRPTLGQAGLLDDFGRVDEARVGIYEFIALGEASLAEELALDVASDTDFSISILLEFFFNYLLRAA